MLQINVRALPLLTLLLLAPLVSGCAFDSPPPSGPGSPAIPPLPAQARPPVTRPALCPTTCSKGFEALQDSLQLSPTTSASGSTPVSAPTNP